MNVQRGIVCLARYGRQFTSSSKMLKEPEFAIRQKKKLKELQKRYAIDDGVPMYLKGGAIDRVLYGATLTLCAVGTVYCFYTIYELAQPKKN
ncbi:cytochrome c oxidase subunit 7A1, mitochondrial-like [Centruroides vittatus]|uniref:cytochrome c oxidase subunit 7A1, mitochondrial-like n=1 Tax=Centruroides vittatus TaxID=120091 RepID=UPI00350ED88F